MIGNTNDPTGAATPIVGPGNNSCTDCITIPLEERNGKRVAVPLPDELLDGIALLERERIDALERTFRLEQHCIGIHEAPDFLRGNLVVLEAHFDAVEVLFADEGIRNDELVLGNRKRREALRLRKLRYLVAQALVLHTLDNPYN